MDTFPFWIGGKAVAPVRVLLHDQPLHHLLNGVREVADLSSEACPSRTNSVTSPYGQGFSVDVQQSSNTRLRQCQRVSVEKPAKEACRVAYQLLGKAVSSLESWVVVVVPSCGWVIVDDSLNIHVGFSEMSLVCSSGNPIAKRADRMRSALEEVPTRRLRGGCENCSSGCWRCHARSGTTLLPAATRPCSSM